MWAQTYDRDISLDWAYSLIATSDGGYTMVGYTQYSVGVNYDFWLVKTDALGNIQWNQTYGGEGGDSPDSLIATSDGGYAIIGTTDSFGAGNTDFWLVKTDANGNIEWNQTYGGPTVEIAGALVATSDGGYALAGGWNCSAGGADFWLIKTDEFGNVEWNQTYGGADYDGAGALVATSDGGYALAGYTESFGAGNRDFWLIKTDANGNMEWNKTYGGADVDGANSLVATSDGGYALAGGTISFGVGGGDLWFIKTDENGVAPVVPEAPWVVLPLLVTATLAIFISKKKLHIRSQVA
jgi:hypothetical protein